MKRATREWVEKAEGDFAVAGREPAAPAPVFDAVCFHAQQCVEKYLKALLQDRGIDFPRTHDLVALAARVEGVVAARLRAAGAAVDEKIETQDGGGRFGWATDPEGNRFELWEPAPAVPNNPLAAAGEGSAATTPDGG